MAVGYPPSGDVGMESVPGLRIELLDKRECVLLGIDGRIPPERLTDAENVLHDIIASGRTRIVGDLRNAELISPEGIGVWLYYLKRVLALGGRVVLVRPPGAAMDALRSSGAEGAFEFADSLDEAVRMISKT
jgi:anti-anti-sigma regulatory factor